MVPPSRDRLPRKRKSEREGNCKPHISTKWIWGGVTKTSLKRMYQSNDRYELKELLNFNNKNFSSFIVAKFDDLHNIIKFLKKNKLPRRAPSTHSPGYVRTNIIPGVCHSPNEVAVYTPYSALISVFCKNNLNCSSDPGLSRVRTGSSASGYRLKA